MAILAVNQLKVSIVVVIECVAQQIGFAAMGNVPGHLLKNVQMVDAVLLGLHAVEINVVLPAQAVVEVEVVVGQLNNAAKPLDNADNHP